MKAARLHEYMKPLQIDDMPVPEINSDGTLVKVVASYVCSSDLDLVSGRSPAPKLPLTLGHNNTGYIEKVGQGVVGFKVGDPVAVYGAWGCGRCHFCRQGEEQLCNINMWTGFGVDGGFAEYMHVPAQRHLVKFDGIDLVGASLLLDAGLTPYRAVKKALPYLYPGSTAVIIGVGNLGSFAVQIMKAISPDARVIAVDVADKKLQLASELGADYVVDARGKAVDEIKRIIAGEGAQAVIDIVGSNSTLQTAAAIMARKGILLVCGLAGGTLPYSYTGLPFECVVTNSVWGSYTEFEEVLALAANRKFKYRIQHFPLEDINNVYHAMETEQTLGHCVIMP